MNLYCHSHVMYISANHACHVQLVCYWCLVPLNANTHPLEGKVNYSDQNHLTLLSLHT